MASFPFAVITSTEATQGRRHELWLTDQGKLIAVGTSRSQEREAAGSGASTVKRKEQRTLPRTVFRAPDLENSANHNEDASSHVG